MVKVSVMYPGGADTRFDWGYYLEKHMPMVQAKLGAVCKKVDIDQGVGGGQPGSSPAFVAMCHLYFDSLSSYEQAFGAHGGAIVADIPNYTNVQPTVQVSEVKR